MAPPMPDEFYQQYEHFSHPELYNMVMAGVPTQVDSLLSVWKSIETTLSGLSASLRTDLDRLLTGLGQPGRPGVRPSGRSGRVVRTGAGRRVRRHPHRADGHVERARRRPGQRRGTGRQLQRGQRVPRGRSVGRLVARAVGMLIGGVIGGSLGRERDEAEQENARQRMVRLVIALATDYRVTDFGTWPQQVPVPSADLPGYQPGAALGEAPPAVQQVNVAPAAVRPGRLVRRDDAADQHGPVGHPGARRPRGQRRAQVPGVVGRGGPGPDHDRGRTAVVGHGPAVAGVVGAAVAGTIAAAGAAANRGRGEGDGNQSMGDGPRLDSDGVVRVSEATG